ncbi:MAG: c-type cytochrome biogenesis protein CcmI [Pseudomonadota bacterium]|nr:c-type cytochrome biogenesis protein CcmI [Pseudomonadota bacterium]
MTVFLVAAITLVVIALAIILSALIRPADADGPDADHTNLQLARQRLAELETDIEYGRIDPSDYDAVRADLERTLLADLSNNDAPSTPLRSRRAVISAVLIGLVIPSAAAFLYFVFGTPQAIVGDATAPQTTAGTENRKLPPVDVLVEQLEKKVAEQPSDIQGLSLLANTYISLRRYDDAVQILERWRLVDPNNSDLLARYADALAMANDGVLTGKPMTLIERALEINPDQIQALWLAAMAADEANDLPRAIGYLSRLQKLVVDNQEAHREVSTLLASARSRSTSSGITANTPLNELPSSGPNKLRIAVLVMIDPSLSQQVNQTDTVFIYAVPTDGSKMPAAVARRRAVEFPMRVILDDSLAVMPTHKLSNLDQVEIVARISRTGDAQATSGDIIGATGPISVAVSDTVTVTLSRVVP